MYTDITGPDLTSYRGSVAEPDDFDDFWRRTLAAAREHPVAVRTARVDTGLTTVDTYDVSFAGWDGQRVAAWLTVPAGSSADAPLPAVVEYLGYGGGRGLPTERLLWASSGVAHLLMDTRGQGSGWATGDTPDPDGSGPAIPGVMTRGIESPDTYYYRRLTTDAVRAVDAVRDIDLVDGRRVAVLGGSQGGGMAIAVAGLVEGLAGVFPRVPFLCDHRHATQITDAYPYHEVVDYLATHRTATEQVFGTLAYFDGVLHAARATAPAWFSVALMDPICPPSTVYAAYNAWGGPKEITVWEYNGHEGGGAHEDADTLPRLRALFG
ncbi:acetylxylan esterase [Curtobacterium sp. MCPF17_046]|uniref:acetylxylan esterase n=1 Tax=Curtobacterium sp. MCPF17_046 TaxID=2175663 RepID=UPI0021ABC127|nr:acetylxylan esterase [Curtobacterium sp. MCPF17_046]